MYSFINPFADSARNSQDNYVHNDTLKLNNNFIPPSFT